MGKRNHYEKAFQGWLDDGGVAYVLVGQEKRAIFSRAKIKSFDMMLYPMDRRVFLAEVKGRKFEGDDLRKKAAMQCWVKMDDVDGLARWQEVFGKGFGGAFVFVYEITKLDVEAGESEIFEFDGRRYVFYLIELDDYRRSMVLRSPKWRTVTLTADGFREYAKEASELLF